MSSEKSIHHESLELPVNFECTDEFKDAFELVEQGNDPVFITGKAGSGKSTFLIYFRLNTKKNVAVVAPTGVAALNVRGQTIHSFFLLPPRLIQRSDCLVYKKLSLIMRRVDILIIDEASMLRPDVLDGMDYVLRMNRGNMETPFGGVKVIFIGDMYQLPPIIDKNAQKYFYERYKSPYFSCADVIGEVQLKKFEFTQIFRQLDESFIHLLNRVREGDRSQDLLAQLNKQVITDHSDIDEQSIVLTARNVEATTINTHSLNKLDSECIRFSAKIWGEFDQASYPTEEHLEIKTGSKVMLLKNDSDQRWVNGTIGIVADVQEEYLSILIHGKEHYVERAKWEKIKYIFSEEEEKIVPKVIGSFIQYPIKLAWAITIHKSQGKTFDKVVVDVGRGAFAHGQLYVALSRARTLENLSLITPISASDIICDNIKDI